MALLKAPELMKAHVSEVPSGWDTEPGLSEGTDIMPHGTGPIRSFFCPASNEDRVAAFEIWHRSHEP